jgi:diaminohydroxyphosphoribosylaminopyrimidine deaminase/5-amino-6-(5-phosphoribosylamino)uracil reductase
VTSPAARLLFHEPHRPPPAARIAEAFGQAVAAARAFVGATAPNPPVGCVLLDARGVVLADAAHQRAGQAHAEAGAIAACQAAGTVDRIHTALVTLEPCSHHGRTPPCVEALLATPARHVWVGALDPHPRAPGAGMARLAGAGIDVRLIAALEHPRAAALARDAARLVAPFAAWARTGRPWVVVKTALDAVGGMIPPPGRTTFTSPDSLARAHRLRRAADAIVTGSGCILADDPAFTVRRVADHPGKRRRLAIMDRRGRTPAIYLDAARARGFEVSLHAGLEPMLAELGASGVLTALVEAGPTLRQAILEAGLWDEAVTFRQNATAGEPDAIDVDFRVPSRDAGVYALI